MKRMMLYLWEDTDAPGELKFGERFSNCSDIESAIADINVYIRSSQGKRKHKYDDGRIITHYIWDASEYAKYVDRFKPHAKLDDFIRNKLVLGERQGRGEFHKFIDPDEFIICINKELNDYQNSPEVKLSTKQFDQLQAVIRAFANGCYIILAELCARFGKTIWAGSLIRETESQLTVITSYVLSSFYSFIKEFTSFQQFQDFVLVDTKDDDYKNRIIKALAEGKQVIAFLSLCNGDLRQDRVDFLYDRDIDVLTIVDEADFGAHHPNQCDVLINAQKKNDRVILMTGTGADRAVGNWDVDYHTSVTYVELLAEKKF